MQPIYTKIDDNTIGTTVPINISDILSQRKTSVSQVMRIQKDLDVEQAKIDAIDAQIQQAQALGVQSAVAIDTTQLPLSTVFATPVSITTLTP